MQASNELICFLQACRQLSTIPDRTLLDQELKRALGYQGKEGHRAWTKVKRKAVDMGLLHVYLGTLNERPVTLCKLLQTWEDLPGPSKVCARLQSSEQPVPIALGLSLPADLPALPCKLSQLSERGHPDRCCLCRALWLHGMLAGQATTHDLAEWLEMQCCSPCRDAISAWARCRVGGAEASKRRQQMTLRGMTTRMAVLQPSRGWP